ncbi:MAG: DUF2332 domain-containing protein [Sphingomonadales bacterium]|nr:DUF2332 domain-containing protein [Sphingomonadales bacterium]
MGARDVAQGIAWQAEHAARNDAPITARICLAQLAVMQGDTATGRRISTWPGAVIEDALPLRLAAAFHHLHLTGAEARLTPVYTGAITDQAAVDAAVLAVVRDHDAALLRWLDGPPQTNEAGRSASFIAALAWLSGRIGPRFEMNELGASAGCNTMIERYRYELGGVGFGPAGSPVRIAPEWRGPPPPAAEVTIAAISGCDRAPIDLADRAQALRLKSYIWPEQPFRLERLDQIIALAQASPPRLVRAEADAWVPVRLAAPQPAGVTRVFYHSIVWQYLAPEARARIEAALRDAGARASAQRPLAWVMLETNRATFRHELRVRHWPGPAGWTLLGEAQAHGAWVEWRG